ncbi:MAG: TVP38/TMEM64 family protein [Microcoleaceae cyanobacterium]
MNPTTIVAQMEQWGHWAILGFLGLYLGLTFVGIPAIPITVAGGVFFGIIWGTLLSVFGATVGAIAAFGLTRSYLRNWVQKKLADHQGLVKFNRAATNNPLKFVLFVRLAPVFPFNLSNFLFGLTPIGYKPYIVGTFFGIIPGTFAYTWLGVTGKQAIEQGDRLAIFLSLTVGIILCLLPLFKRIGNSEL